MKPAAIGARPRSPARNPLSVKVALIGSVRQLSAACANSLGYFPRLRRVILRMRDLMKVASYRACESDRLRVEDRAWLQLVSVSHREDAKVAKRIVGEETGNGPTAFE